jgi:hypothetical protein
MGNPRAENWRDSAGVNPLDETAWRVCDLVHEMEDLLGRSHSRAGAERRQNARGRKPARRV